MKRVILVGDTRERLRNDVDDDSVDCIVTSPPYWALRDYGVSGQLGLEPTWREHMANLREVFAECYCALKPTGSLWVNYGDTISAATVGSRDAGSWVGKGRAPEAAHPANAPNRLSKADPPKHKLGLAWRLRFMLNDDLGFISRADIVWHKPNSMPLSMKDRVTPKYEMLFHLVKKPRYWFDLDAIRKPFNPDPRESCAPRLARGTQKPMPPGQKADSLHRVRSDNTWEARRGASIHGKGPASGQKPHSTQRPSFNLRVRDAQRGVSDLKWGTLDGKRTTATPEDVAAYEPRDAKPRRDKTLDADALGPSKDRHLRLPPEKGEDGGPDANGQYGGLGANPGDVWEIPWTEADEEWDSAIWTIPNQPFREAHFATFPEELARRCIVSSCPREICTKCFLGRRLAVSAPEMVDERGRPRKDGERFQAATESGSHRAPGEGMAGTGRARRLVLGYRDCGCGAPFTPGVVLDPFAGAFTVPFVAAREGRGFVAIELNPKYVDIGLRRVAPYMRPLGEFGGAEA